MSFCCALIPAPASVCTKLSASNPYRSNIYKNEKRDRVLGMSLSFGISGAACSTNGKFKFRLRRRRRCKSQLEVAELAPATSATYGILLLGGGLFAFLKSGSKGSLFGGLTGAALMATASYLLQSPDTKAIGDALGFGSAFLFSSVFGIRLAATRKLIPAGPLLGLSICASAVFILAYLQDSL